jgi:HSP20 family protein
MSVLLRRYRFPFDALRDELERALGEDWPLGWSRAERGFPPVNVYENQDAVVLEFEVPGVRPEDAELTITGGSVSLKVKRAVEGDIPPERYYVRERWRGEFGRSVTVPGTVDSSKASASYGNGLLTVTIPKAEEARPKRIQVNVEKGGEAKAAESKSPKGRK